MRFAPTHAFVPAAGLGTRMRHLTADHPKPLIEVAGRTLLDRVLDRIDAAGVGDVVVNVHYKADQIETALAERAHPAITISDERDRLLDTGGGVAKALPLLGNAPFLIHNSDSIWIDTGTPTALPALFAAWNNDTMDCLMLLAETTSSIGYAGDGDFSMSADGRLTRRSEGTLAPFVFTGVSVTAPRMFDDAPGGAFSINRLWDRAIRGGRLFGMVLDGRWMHVGTPESVNEAGALLAAASERE